jgi:hypothetical protein
VEVGEDPLLAWAWGKRVRLVRVQSNRKENEVIPKGGVTAGVDFAQIGEWDCDSRVLALRWYSEKVSLFSVCLLANENKLIAPCAGFDHSHGNSRRRLRHYHERKNRKRHQRHTTYRFERLLFERFRLFNPTAG